jgi:ATP synthase protein I
MPDRKPGLSSLRRLTEMSSIGLALPSSIIVGAAFGWLLDKALGTRPWLLLAFFVLGAVSGVMSLFRALARYEKTDKDP